MRLEKMILGQLMIGERQGTCRGPAITTTIAFANLLKYIEDLLTSKRSYGLVDWCHWRKDTTLWYFLLDYT